MNWSVKATQWFIEHYNLTEEAIEIVEEAKFI